MRFFSIIAVTFFLVCLAVPALSADGNQIRLGAGVGLPYGGRGLNAEYRINNYASVGAGLGYFRYDGPGWALGAAFYPLKNVNTFNPRLSSYYGRVGTLSWSDGRKEYYLGGTFGGGFEWRVLKNLSLDFDISYVVKDLPAGVKNNNDNVLLSTGIGIMF